MQSRKLGFGLVAVAVAVAVALFFVLRDEDGDDADTETAAQVTTEQAGDGEAEQPAGGGGQGPAQKPEPEVAEIVVRGGEPVDGVAELEFDKGEQIRFAVRSDVADEVHLHGYDVTMDVEAGGRVEFDVPATLDGVFEVELEERVVPLAEITVNPG